ncbi:response regulator transcription factor [Metabacillus bambusae]|uniref:Response regulator transcription factor n=1 Tax=Metabacillus bambusae TaxID=2795218 RepID=A0ABS3MZ52_9BACI|nr:response regulator transcription factor [Metabacillus bambusae]MBO1511312.1 response regulator transcription factor [Metabacillus bambusae]
MKTVLLIDDEQRMLDLLSLYLSPYGYKCIKKVSGNDGIQFLEKEDVDIVILDVMMPDMDGWTTCKKIRDFSNVPIIMLTARSAKEDIVKGLKTGADDYLSKPFNEQELLARIEAVIRRISGHKNEERHITFKGLTLNKSTFELRYLNEGITLTPKEFALLELFLNYPNKVFSREHLLTTLWGLRAETEDRTIDSHIRNIREKLRHARFPVDKHLKTVWGVGYKWSSDAY